MKRIIAATMTAMLLCSASAYAQTPAQDAAKPSAAPAAGASTTGQQPPVAEQNPAIDVSKLTPNQREYLVLSLMKVGGGSAIAPEQITKFKEMYEKMPPEQQTQTVTQIAAQIPHLPKKMYDDIMNNMPSK